MVEINSLEQIKKKLGLNDNGPVEKFLVQTCYKYMDKYVPKDTGMLRRIVYLDSHSITYMSPYASYQYYGQRADGSHKVRHYTTNAPVQTGKKWDETMMKLDGKQVVKEVQKYIVR